MKIKNSKSGFFKLIFVLIITIIIIAIFKLWPETKGEEIIPESITVEFSSGEKIGTFENSIQTLSTNKISGYITLPTEFANTVSVKQDAYFEKVDNETFYFEQDEYSYTFTGWKVEGAEKEIPGETVFQPGDKIEAKNIMQFDKNKDGKIQLEAIWGKVIYAENPYKDMYYTDYWILDLETTKTHEKTNSWNYKLNEDNTTITLNDGKDSNNPVSTLDYAYYLIYQLDYKNNFTNAKSHNSYEYVIMLTGDLDYIKSNSNGTTQKNFFTTYDIYDGTYDETKNYIFKEYTAQQKYWGYVGYFQSNGNLNKTNSDSNARNYSPSVSFKSCMKNNSENYNLYLNGYGYSDSTYSSIRIDNVNYKKSPDTKRPHISSPVSTATETAFYGRQDCFIEFTRRATSDNFVFRPNAVQTVVVNGSNFSSWQTSWSTSQTIESYPYDIHWYMGENAKVSGDITLGTTANYVTTESIITQNIYFTMTGGTAGNIYGASNGMNSSTSGIKKITIVGDNGSSTTTNPKIKNIFGAGNTGPFTGNTDITIKGVTNITNVYGGGSAFTATTYGNTNINISHSSISGDIFGGGLNGNVQKDSEGNGGNVNLDIYNSKIGGNIFGSGMGGTQTLTVALNASVTQAQTNWQNVTYIPDDAIFKNVKDENNGDYNTNWDWDKPATGFPFIQNDTDYICTAIYKRTNWTNNNESNLTFYRDYIYAYLSIAVVENDVNITIDASTIGTQGNNSKGNIYGGGSVAVVQGNTYVTIKENSKVYGNIYGGGDGITMPEKVSVYYPAPEENYNPPSYNIVRDSEGNITNVTGQAETSTYKKYKYDGEFEWSNEKYLINQGGIDVQKNLIYSPNVGSLGVVNGNTNVTIENSEIIKNVYAGGNAAKVLGETNIIITNSKAKDIFGGGYSGNIDKNTNITVNSGNIQNVFGGGDLGVVNGNTQVIIGNSNNPNINITELLYGGGRGIDSDNDGNASDFITVNGTSTVIIEGINTFVENYGSSTIGAVKGDINVTFKNYWTGNATNQYKTMNGIDRATNVYFENSYVLLTNRDDNGELIGIKSIENLYIPQGSGLKVSAPGEISGNFEGGGELYLDSEVCMTIKGNITGTTTLVLNPLMYEETYVIKGSIDNPYMEVYGEIPENSLNVEIGDAKALISGDNRYKILFQKTENYTKYFINEDIVITQNISETILLNHGKQYNTNTEKWETANINMLQDSSITANITINYQYRKEESTTNKYKNIERSIIIKSGEQEITIPKNTKITMITIENGEQKYYKYKTEIDTPKVNLKEFTQIENNNQRYIETSDITEKAIGDPLTNVYTYNENFQFIINFEECENYLEANKTYNILLDKLDNNQKIDELNFTATNTMNIFNARNIVYNAELEKRTIKNTENLKIIGNISAEKIEDNTIIYDDSNKNIGIQIALKDNQGNYIKIPEGTTIKVNDIDYELKQNIAYEEILELTKEEINNQANIEINMNKVLPEKVLQEGTYKVEITTYLSENKIKQKKIQTKELEFNIMQDKSYGIIATFISDTENKDKLQLLKNNNKKLQITVDKGNLQNPNLKIEIQRRTAPFTYVTIENTITDKEIKSNELKEINIININKGLEEGTYRIIINLYDENNIKYAEEKINFIVKNEE